MLYLLFKSLEWTLNNPKRALRIGAKLLFWYIVFVTTLSALGVLFMWAVQIGELVAH